MLRINQPNSIDQLNLRHSWLSHLTSQSIPEESDLDDYSTDSDCSSTLSTEECYFIVNCQRDLCYAKIYDDDQFVESMIIEIPIQLQTIEHQSENFNFAKMTEIIYQNHPVPKLPGTSFQQPNIDLDLRENVSPATSNVTRSFVFNRACIDKYETHPSFSLMDLLKKRFTNRTIQSEFHLSTNEPLLLRLTNLDNRRMFIDQNALETFQKSQILTTSISSQTDLSYRTRLFNRFQKFLRISPKIFL